MRKICRKASQQVAVLNRLKKIFPFELRTDIYIVLSLHRILITVQSRGITVAKKVPANLKKSMSKLCVTRDRSTTYDTLLRQLNLMSLLNQIIFNEWPPVFTKLSMGIKALKE